MKIDRSNFQNYGIITDRSKPLAFAKEELQNFVQRSCGFSLSDYKDQPYFISLGVNEKSAEIIAEYDLDGLNGDGFYIVPNGGNLYIFGENEKAVLFGVYELLESCLGIRFLSKDCEYVPKTTQIELEAEIKKIPVSAQRIYLCNSANDDPLTNLRYRFSADYTPELEEKGFRNKWYKGIPCGHNSNFYVPYEEYKESNPEFFSVYQYQGFRLFEAVELCYTNGLTENGEYDENIERSVLSVTVDSLLKFIKEEPHAEYFMFGRIDNADARCRCEKCEKARKEYGDAGIMIVFMNAVISRLRQIYKEQGKTFDKKLVTFAYLSTVNPPVKDGKEISSKVIPDENLYIRYAPISADYTYAFEDSRQMQEVKDQLAGWSVLTKNLMVWDYNVNFSEYFWYFPNLSYMQRNMQTFAKLGMHYIMKQGANNVGPIWLDEIRSYVHSKLFWDVNADVQKYIEEYVRIYFGVGAECVLSYLTETECYFHTLIEKGLRLDIGGGDSGFFAPENYPLEMFQRHERLIETGIEEVENSDLTAEEKAVYRKRLQSVLITPVRMIVRNAEGYFGKENLAYEEKFRRLADAIGVKNSGEVVPIYIDFVNGGASSYKIITGQNPTEAEKEACKRLQNFVYEKTGCSLPIETDSSIYPAYWERGIMVGKTAMTKEFYKEGLDISGYSYFADVKGWCVFLDSDYDMTYAVNAFIKEFLRKGDGENSLELISKKRIGKRKE